LKNHFILLLKLELDRINLCTSAFFEGTVAITDPRASWMAKWLRVDGYLPGVYAISITGQLDRDMEETLEHRGLRWRCRPAESLSTNKSK